MHWIFLELDRDHATAKEVRRTYAQRLKKCRPDQDPEGFRQLHDAYRSALEELEWRARAADFPVEIVIPGTFGETESPASPTSVAALHAGISEAFQRLEDALRSESEAVADRVRDAEKALFKNPDHTARWADLMFGLIGKYGSQSGLRLTPDAMIFELEHQSVAATIAVIDRLDREENRQAISNLASLLLERKSRVQTAAGGIAASRLACVAAFWAKGKVGPLADFAYENLARGERDFHMQLIDRHNAIAELVESVPLSMRNFWRRRLIEGSAAGAWEDEASTEALRWLASSGGQKNPAFEVLRGLLPTEVVESLVFAKAPPPQRIRQRQAVSWDSEDASSYRRPAIDTAYSSVWRGLGFLRFLFFPIVLALGRMATFSSDNHVPAMPAHEFRKSLPITPDQFENRPLEPPDLKRYLRDRDSRFGPAPAEPSTNPLFNDFANPQPGTR